MTTDLRALLAGALGSGFRIVRELSGGGMSRVFLAEEVALGREVVVKVLAPELVGEGHLERFRQEILQTARLQHPSIVPLLTVGTVTYPTGVQGPYYIMPYIRGETLRSRLQREGAFSTGATLRILRDVLEALVHAHRHGVIHRDIKPENIFVAGGHAVVTDFGIAKAISGSGEPGVATLPGLVVGTPMYMAPEQAAGDEVVDHRADLYSLGVVGYELLSGRTPFSGMSTRQVLVAHARATPEPIDRLRPGLPPELARAVMSCLEREPGARWQGAEEMLRHLEGVRISDPGLRLTAETVVARGQRRMGWVAATAVMGVLGFLGLRNRSVTGGTGLVPPSALVVLPPTLNGDTTGLSVLASVLKTDLNHDLQRRGLTVLDPLAAEDLLGLGDFRTVADSLNARYLVRSEMLRVGDVIRVSFSLDDYRSSLQVLWPGQFAVGESGGAADLDAAIRAIADTVVDSVTTRLALAGDVSAVAAVARGEGPRERSRRERRPEVAMLLGEADKAMRLRTREAFARAMEGFRRAAAADPDDPGPHAGLSSVYALLMVYTYRSDVTLDEAAARSLAHAERAVELDPASDEALTARAYVLNLLNAPTDTVRRDFARALALNPSSQPGWYSVLLMREGLKDSALREAARGVALDPKSPGRRINLGWDAIGLREDALAVTAADSAYRLDPGLPLTRGLLARALLAAGQLARCAGFDPDPYAGTRAACLYRLGRREAARAVVDSLLLRYHRDGSDTLYDDALYAQELAIYFGALGEREAALTWVREAFARNPAGIAWPFLRSRLFDPVRQGTTFDAEVANLEAAGYHRIREEARKHLATLRPAT